MCLASKHTNQPAGLTNDDIAVTEAHQHDLRYCTLQLQVPNASVSMPIRS